MAKGGSEGPHGRPITALDSREQALLARRLALGVADRELQQRLIAYAMELEAQIAAKEEAAPKKAEPLRMATGQIVWEDDGAAAALALPVPVAQFSLRTRQLLRGVHEAVERAAAVQRWRMLVRRPFQGR